MKYQDEQLEETLARAIQRVVGSTKEEFIEDTIVGSDVNQIRHLFFHLKSDKVHVTVSYMSENYPARVEEVSNTSIMLKTESLREGPLRRCNIRFEAFSVLYQFEVLIQSFRDNQIIIKIPYFIQSARHRKYKRVSAGALHLRFITTYQPFFNSSSDNQIALNRFRHIITELEKDVPDIHLIYRIIIGEIQKISPHYNVKFYREETPIEIADNIVRKEKKTLFIEDLNKIETLYEIHHMYNLTSFYNHFNDIRKDSNEEDAIKNLENIRRKYLSDFIHKIVISPFKIFNNVVGSIFIYSTLLEARYISAEQAHIVDLMMELLSYAMTKNVMAATYYKDPITPVVNMSISGLLFNLTDEEVFDYLTFHDRLKLTMQIKHEFIHFYAEISRYFPSGKGYDIGVNFLSGEPENYKILENFIHDQNMDRILKTGKA